MKGTEETPSCDERVRAALAGYHSLSGNVQYRGLVSLISDLMEYCSAHVADGEGDFYELVARAEVDRRSRNGGRALEEAEDE